ncbi:hypothetical protein HOLleu_44230 [Holothuria leucospilota]|uniref:Uncharacterized protein n=1 Tax=Holothuria leucospilota TaxID=206669 RepID=A0A9Q1BB10_HOLLE|nr:hypothetical protein HOLleu_44230 [Holothuria leucospilota]
MLREEDLTLEKAINTCRAAESSKSQVKTLTGSEQACYSVSQKKWGNSAKPSRSKYRPKGTKPNNESTKPKSLGQTQRGGNLKQKQFNCKKCGTRHNPGECPAYGEICRCQKKGHFARCCFQNPERKIGAVGAQCDAKQYESMTEDEETTGLFLDTIYMNSLNNTLVEDDWMADIKLGKRKVRFKLDTGAQANILPLRVFRQIAKRQSLHKTGLGAVLLQNDHPVAYASRALTQTQQRKDPYLCLLAYRNTPLGNGLGSPVQLLMNRRLKGLLPTTAKLLQPQVQGMVKKKLQDKQSTQKMYYDRKSHPLEPLQKGDIVRVRSEKGEWEQAKVVAPSEQPKSYIVEMPKGKIRRNRRDLMKTKEENDEIATEVDTYDNSVLHTNDSGKKQEFSVPEKHSSSGRVIKQPRRYIEEC